MVGGQLMAGGGSEGGGEIAGALPVRIGGSEVGGGGGGRLVGGGASGFRLVMVDVGPTDVGGGTTTGSLVGPAGVKVGGGVNVTVGSVVGVTDGVGVGLGLAD